MITTRAPLGLIPVPLSLWVSALRALAAVSLIIITRTYTVIPAISIRIHAWGVIERRDLFVETASVIIVIIIYTQIPDPRGL